MREGSIEAGSWGTREERAQGAFISGPLYVLGFLFGFWWVYLCLLRGNDKGAYMVLANNFTR